MVKFSVQEMNPFLQLLAFCLRSFSALTLCACGGGGGGGGGTDDGTKRTTGTGIRIISGALDAPPVDLKIGEQYLNRGAFLLPNFYAAVDSGLQNVILERANSPGETIFSQALTLADKTEYSLLLSGREARGTFAATVLEEPVVRPEKGQARVQLVNLLEGSGSLIMSGGGVTQGPVPFGGASGYAVLASGPQTFVITNSRGGIVGTIPTTITDRGEVTIVTGGSTAEGVVLSKVYNDLD